MSAEYSCAFLLHGSVPGKYSFFSGIYLIKSLLCALPGSFPSKIDLLIQNCALVINLIINKCICLLKGIALWLQLRNRHHYLIFHYHYCYYFIIIIIVDYYYYYYYWIKVSHHHFINKNYHHLFINFNLYALIMMQ